ncbi:ribbon-helix-helix domain-containing protein [Cupriavidus sp. CV2]|uniref:ribbon-helix-helix domain-containing protein n=1 Tax=Cupriavidus ulmosensis TaxID=3065913 RepID=UPI00296B2993|nr:ribbon-helix-helix domain-containing protein [Cupriavidus sp. CV2]MDW3681392.1 ribbon-helix-helix domain-containing protein [Cupriavidus sp. CV2]
MCEIFIRATPQSYQGQSRSLRLHGVATSIRLESLFWEVLETLARRDGMSVGQLITRLHDELVAYRGEAANFTSFLRVCCLRYLMLQGEGRIPADPRVPIGSLDARSVLEGLPPSWAEEARVGSRAAA